MKYEIVNESTPTEPAPVKIRLVVDDVSGGSDGKTPLLQFCDNSGNWVTLAWLAPDGVMMRRRFSTGSLESFGFKANNLGMIAVNGANT